MLLKESWLLMAINTEHSSDHQSLKADGRTCTDDSRHKSEFVQVMVGLYLSLYQ
jgi:hypothetical protein